MERQKTLIVKMEGTLEFSTIEFAKFITIFSKIGTYLEI